MLNICTQLWSPNEASFSFSKKYDETWVDKLYRGFRRNLSGDFRFTCFTDRNREFEEPINQLPILRLPPDYGTPIEVYRLGKPMIHVGLDTVITGDINHLADYCFTGNKVALPNDPYHPSRSCNGVALVPGGNQAIFDKWDGENDMMWMRKQSTVCLDDLFPGQVVSYKVHVRANGLGDARIVYFHGNPKMHQLQDDWLREHWQ